MAKEKAIVLSTHILEEVDAMCTRIIVIANGKVIVDSTPTAIRESIPARAWKISSATAAIPQLTITALSSG